MANPNKSGILILGAGELGTAVVESLLRHPIHSDAKQPITIVKRSTTGPFTSNPAVTIQPFDLQNSSSGSLSSLIRSFHTIISCTGFGGPPGLQKKIAECVLAESTAYFIPWQFGVDYDIIGKGSAQDLFTEQLEVRAMLRAQTTTAWNIVSVGVFLSFLFEPLFGIVDASGGEDVIVRALGDWDYELTATSAGDIGRCVAEIVRGDEDIRNEAKDGVLFLAGDTLTYSDLARIVEKATGKSVKRELWSLAYLKEELVKDPDNGLIKYRCVWAEGVGVAWPKEDSFNAKKGIPAETVREYAEQTLSSAS